MSKQVIVSLGREFGSGGHYIAEKLAERLEIPLMDKEMIDRVVKDMGYEQQMVAKFDEKGTNMLFARNLNGYTNSISDYVAQAQFDILRKDAEAGQSFVVVGRCADEILEDNPALIRVFIRADEDFKMRRIVDKYNVSSEKALSMMRKMDRERKYYHNYYCHNKWGDSRGYDLTINSGLLGLEKTIGFLTEFVKLKMN